MYQVGTLHIIYNRQKKKKPKCLIMSELLIE